METVTSPRISVVVPVRDDAPYLGLCLEALARQDVAPHEVIVIDNGVSRETAMVARASGARVVPEDLPGIAAAAARGYDVATGDVIARIDPASGKVVGWVNLAGLLPPDQRGTTSVDAVLNGIAWDARHNKLYVTGKLWPKLFEIELVKMQK